MFLLPEVTSNADHPAKTKDCNEETGLKWYRPSLRRLLLVGERLHTQLRPLYRNSADAKVNKKTRAHGTNTQYTAQYY